MGVTFSDEVGQEDDSPKCDARYLHWLLSDENSVQDAFKAVWGGCSPNDGNVASKSKALEVMLKVISEFERTNSDGGAAIGKMARQLRHVVEPLPETLTRAEALHLFRTALLSLQTALVVKPGASLQYFQPLGRDTSREVDTRDGDSPQLSQNAEQAVLHRRALEAHKLNTLRKTAKGEDNATMALCPKLPPPVRQILPSRQELEMENEQMRALAEQIMESNREELNIVRMLEEEVRASRANASSTSKSRPAGLLTVVEAKSEIAEREKLHLEAEFRVRNVELKNWEEEVGAQQREINALLTQRLQEETAADEASREARDLAAELKTCKRTCGSLESEIASEEVRATALREAFEGRRARFATAETAARNAELSTMRATRRRVAAESAVQREAEAVEEARSERVMAAASSSAKVRALETELSDVQHRVEGAQAALRIGGGLPNSANRTSQAEMALQATRAELAEVLRDHDSEVALEQSSANETAQLEVVRARMEEQLSARRSELQTARSSGSSSAPAHQASIKPQDERELARTAATIRQVEERVAQMRRRETQVQEELQEAQAAAAEGSTVLWERAREVAGELGDAQAALVRRRAQEQTGSAGVLELLRAALQDAESREAVTTAELEELQNHGQRRGQGRSGRTQRKAAAASRDDAIDSTHGIDPNSPLGGILKQIESVRLQAETHQSSGTGQLSNLRKEVKTLEQELDDKEEVIMKLDRLTSKLSGVTQALRR